MKTIFILIMALTLISVGYRTKTTEDEVIYKCSTRNVEAAGCPKIILLMVSRTSYISLQGFYLSMADLLKEWINGSNRRDLIPKRKGG